MSTEPTRTDETATVPDAARDAAVDTWWALFRSPDWGRLSTPEIVTRILAAAAPASERFWRDRIADELDAYAAQRKGDGSWRNGSNAAERREGAIAGIYEAKSVARGSS